MPLHFYPRLIPSLAAIAMIGLTVSLGRWQLERAAEKSVLQTLLESRLKEAQLRLNAAHRDSEAVRYRLVSVRGEYVEGKQIYLDNKSLGDRVGYHVVTPLRMENSLASVLVNRGWIARSKEYPTPPSVAAPYGMVEVSGMAALPSKRFLELSEVTMEGRVWQNLTLERVRETLGLDVLPIILLAEKSGPELIPVRETPDTGIDIHRGYAFQWFALASAIFIVWLAVNIKFDKAAS